MGYQTNMHMNHITALNVLILIAFGGLVSHNQNLERFRLRAFMQTIIVLFLGAVSAWAGVSLNGRHPEFRWLHIMMKLIELIAVPAVPVLIGQTVTHTMNRMNRIALAAAGLHAVLRWPWSPQAGSSMLTDRACITGELSSGFMPSSVLQAQFTCS